MRKDARPSVWLQRLVLGLTVVILVLADLGAPLFDTPAAYAAGRRGELGQSVRPDQVTTSSYTIYLPLVVRQPPQPSQCFRRADVREAKLVCCRVGSRPDRRGFPGCDGLLAGGASNHTIPRRSIIIGRRLMRPLPQPKRLVCTSLQPWRVMRPGRPHTQPGGSIAQALSRSPNSSQRLSSGMMVMARTTRPAHLW